MARIELRNCTVRIRDGLSGTAACNQPITPPMSGDSSLTINSVVLNTDDTDLVPIGARFTIAGETASDTVHTVTGRTPSSMSPTTAITFSPVLSAGTYSSSGAGIAGAATTTTPGGVGVDEVQSIAPYANNVTGGTFTLTLTVNGESPFTTAAIAFGANAATIETAIDVAATAASIPGWVNGDISVTGGPLTTTALTITFDGDNVDETDQGQTTIDGSSLTATIGNKVLTFLPQQIDIKIGDGDVKYTEADEFIYDKDRGELDTVRRGDDVPMEVSLNFTYEHITTGTNETIAPMDAIKRRGSASEWVSSASDLCEPYAVDIQVVHEPVCGTSDVEVTTFPDFRSEKREVSFKDSNIAVSGKCNVTEPITTRE